MAKHDSYDGRLIILTCDEGAEWGYQELTVHFYFMCWDDRDPIEIAKERAQEIVDKHY